MNDKADLSLSSGYGDARLLDDGPHLQVYRATRVSDGLPVLIKLPTPSADREFDRSLLLGEYAAVRNTRSEGILQPLKLIDRADHTALIFQWFDGAPLSSRTDLRRCGNGTFLSAARGIITAVHLVHETGLAHLCLSPRHIYVSGSDGRLEARITGFGILSGRGFGDPASRDLRGVPIHYLSPEASGRLHRPAGPASDLYSLGVVFYEMLTGIVPFNSDDANDVLYWHMARVPVPPREINGSVPEALSRIVMKLLSKDPADRYADARALDADLEERMDDRGERRHAQATPQRGAVRGHLSLPGGIFGRERERLDLYDAYKRARAGDRAFTVISGYAGIGKTVLALELGEEARCRGGTFLTGKFEQFGSEKPYHALSAAFGREILRILGGSEAGLSAWRKRIARALKPNAGIIAECIPELRHVIGDTGKQPRVDPANEENRFLYHFGRFAGLFAGPNAPLVLFIDDLQWADMPSLRLMKYLAQDPGIGHLHMIGAYRDNEVGPWHPLAMTLEEMEVGGGLHRLEMGPLGEGPVNEMISIALGSDPVNTAPLAAALFRKTGGNPFFLREYFSAAQKEGAISAGPDGAPGWDLARIEGMPAAENVVALLIDRLHRLPGPEMELLKAASCVGSRFDRGLLQRCVATDLAAFNRTLRRCIDEGFIAPAEEGAYAFSHDRVQEAAYSFLAPEESERLHLAIGRLLLRRFGDNLSDSLFTVADHLNLASQLMDSPEERAGLQGLNRLAGDKARSSAAWAAAASYYKKAMDLSGLAAWEAHRKETFALHCDYAECLYLNGERDLAESVIGVTMPHAISPAEKVGLLRIFIHIKLLQSEYREVVEKGNQALSLLNYSLAAGDIDEEIRQEYTKIDALLEEKGTSFILDLRSNDSYESSTIIQITQLMALAFYFTNYRMLYLTGLKMFSYTCMNGVSPMSYPWIIGFCACDGFLNNNYRRAYELGSRTIEQCMKDENQPIFCETNQRFVNLVLPWVRHLKETGPLNDRGIEPGIAYGDLDYVCITMLHTQLNNFHLGRNLRECLTLIDDTCSKVAQMKIIIMMEILIGLKNAITCTIGTAEAGDTVVIDDGFKPIISRKNNFVALFHFYTGLMQALYMYGQHERCLSIYHESVPYATAIIGAFHHADRVFYRALALCALLDTSVGTGNEGRLKDVAADLGQLRIWASNCAENFLHRQLLVEAELARHRGETVAAMGLYDRAIESARETGYIQIEAVACERAGLFWRALGKEDFSRIYLRRACDRYRDWGAARKISMMEERHPWLVARGERSDDTEGRETAALMGTLHSLRESESPTDLIGSLADAALRYSGAERLLVFLRFREKTYLLADASPGAISVAIVPFSDVERKPTRYPVELVRAVFRTGSPVSAEGRSDAEVHRNSPYFSCRSVRSMLCIPSDTGRSTLLWYFEHGSADGAFGGVSGKALDMMAVQADAGIEELTGETGAYIDKSLSVRENGRSVIIPHASIVYVSSVGRHSVVHTQGHSYETPRLLREIEESLPSGAFIRIHKQYIVNARFARKLELISQNRHMLRLGDEDDTVLPVGRAYVKALKSGLRIRAD